ncbi:peptidylprolyl isomerase [Draconibacterium halophilum]|uniref:peptidylprolyl isomerase n=1 Tax=Draconibacterium halophilum TaxID=2706887 RepID=A0A6C0R9J6_9BACT|nr:peptidylprolyl isomerase [Draconibacterium halophilum]QIA07114.1 peptidylprolyl isomerase [Draconibacterium halophilum]
MQFNQKIILLCISAFIIWSCNTKPKPEENKHQKRVTIEMVTDRGTIVLELYNETPKHRDNFIKLANEGILDSVLFHRVIENFMIQAGDIDSKNAAPGDTLGDGELNYRVDAEFRPELFHKKGALGAARDGNPERASSSTQFYIVQGKIFNDSLLSLAEKRINGWLADYYSRKDPANKTLVDSLVNAEKREDRNTYKLYDDSLISIAKSYTNFAHYSIPDTQREVYKTLGGTPHLDQNYTVFGEVIKGLNVIDSIASAQTGAFDRPVNDLRVYSVRVRE